MKTLLVLIFRLNAVSGPFTVGPMYTNTALYLSEENLFLNLVINLAFRDLSKVLFCYKIKEYFTNW